MTTMAKSLKERNENELKKLRNQLCGSAWTTRRRTMRYFVAGVLCALRAEVLVDSTDENGNNEQQIWPMDR